MMNWLRREWPTVAVIVVGFVAQLYLATRAIDVLINTLFPDDTFFYFGVARNIAAGVGSTFDGITITNGYHPLWMLVLTGIYKIFASPFPDLLPIRVMLLLQVALNLVTALLVARIIARFTEDRWIRALGVGVWLLNPFLLYQTLNGLETALALCLFALFFLLALRLQEGRAIGGPWLIGLVGGLMILARIDMIMYVGAFLLWLLARQGWQRGWRPAFMSGLYAAIPVVPYFVWNITHFGMLLTGASGAEALVNHVLIVQDHGSSWGQFFKAIIYNSQYELDHFFRRTGMFALGAAFLGAFAALALRGDLHIPGRLRDIPVALALFGGFVLMFIADASVRWTARDWYFVSFNIFLAIAVVCVVDLLARRIAYKHLFAGGLACLILFSFYVDWSKNFRGVNNEMYGQAVLRGAAEWMNANLPPGAVRGSFIPGIQGYFSTSPLIDLDGLVSNDAYAAMQQRHLWSFIEAHVSYISTDDDHFTYRYKSFLDVDDPFTHMKLIYQFPGTSLKVYEIEK